MDAPTYLVQQDSSLISNMHQVGVAHGYILIKAHMNKHAVLENVMVIHSALVVLFVDESLNGSYFQLAHFSHGMNYAITATCLANPYQGRSHFHCNFGVHMSILFIVKVNIVVLIERSYKSPQLC